MLSVATVQITIFMSYIVVDRQVIKLQTGSSVDGGKPFPAIQQTGNMKELCTKISKSRKIRRQHFHHNYIKCLKEISSRVMLPTA